jgi:hypothetical protein
LNNKHLCLIVLEAEKFKLKEPTDLMSGKGPILGLQRVAFLLYFHIAERKEERKGKEGREGG